MTSDPEALARLALELVAVPSVTGQEAPLADLVEARCRALPGVAVERLGNALVARVGERDDAVALVGHLDTVPLWDGHEPRLDGSRVIGRGAADMKGGDAAILAVLAHCARTGSEVACVFYDREEGPNRENGIHAVLADSRLLGRPAFAFVGEPTGCDVHAGCVGVLNADLVFHGRTAHSARPWEGESAILRAVPFLERAAATAQRPVEVEGLTFYDTLCITQIHGGVARNVVPDRLELALNVRFAPGRKAEVARREIDDLVAGEGELTWIDESPAAPPRLSAPVLARFLAESGARVFRNRPGRTSPRCRRTAFPPSTTGPARRTRRTSRASGSRARPSRRWPRRSPASSDALKATVAAMRVAKWQGLGTTSSSSSGRRGRSRRSACGCCATPRSASGPTGCWRSRSATTAFPWSCTTATARSQRSRATAPASRPRTRPAAWGWAQCRCAPVRAPVRRTSAPTGASRYAWALPRSRARRRISAHPIPASHTASSRPATRTACSRSRTPGRSRTSYTRARCSARTDSPSISYRRPSIASERAWRSPVAHAGLGRGVGETRACGSGCAAAVAAIVDGHCDSPVTVRCVAAWRSESTAGSG